MASEIHTELSKRLKNGDEAAFEIIFKSLYEPLVSFANDYLFEIEISKNIVQEVFMKLWEKRAFVDINANLKAFLYTSTRNLCLSHLRHLKIKQAYFEKSRKNFEDLMLNYQALSQLNFEKTDFDTIESIINETIETLSPRCKEVFTLSRYEELSNKEIAEKLGITVKAVEANITRALKKLKNNLKTYIHPALLAIIFDFFTKN